MARVDQEGEGTYWISVFTPEKRITFNQFVIDDERPALVHTGQYPMYEEVRAAVSQILDPSRLAYIIVPHFEADECGGMGRFVAEAKQGGNRVQRRGRTGQLAAMGLRRPGTRRARWGRGRSREAPTALPRDAARAPLGIFWRDRHKRSTAYVGSQNGLPKRVIAEDNTIIDYYDYGAHVVITLPPCTQ